MSTLTIQTPCGALAGLQVGEHLEFRGVPYAQPPVGPLRWRAPAPMEGWEGTVAATAFRPMAPQAELRGMPFYGKEFYDEDAYFPGQSEDCLYLNIWCPPIREGARLPVAVWFHGGSFDHGAPYEKEFDGAEYARRGVILVAAAYRLGALGFLASRQRLAQDGFAGNYGHLDQLEAVRWVRRNIAAFGGDGENITVFGQSAGSFSVQNLLSMDREGLIKRAILQSGLAAPGLSLTVGLEQGFDLCDRLMEKLGVADFAQLEQIPARDIVSATNALGAQLGRTPFVPVIDGVNLTGEGPYPMPAQKNIPILAGATRDDILASDGANPLLEGARAYALRPDAGPGYLYHFAHDLPGSADGCFHSCELWYTFGTLGRCWRPMTGEDEALSRQILDYWTNFMRTGDPNGPGLPWWEECRTGAVKEFT